MPTVKENVATLKQSITFLSVGCGNKKLEDELNDIEVGYSGSTDNEIKAFIDTLLSHAVKVERIDSESHETKIEFMTIFIDSAHSIVKNPVELEIAKEKMSATIDGKINESPISLKLMEIVKNCLRSIAKILHTKYNPILKSDFCSRNINRFFHKKYKCLNDASSQTQLSR